MSLIKLKFNYGKLSPCGHLHITDKIEIPGESYRGLTLAITEIRTRKYALSAGLAGLLSIEYFFL